ncbi:MAG: nuclear transport factor 2 family protein [Steroidobacteraceae bacterium]
MSDAHGELAALQARVARLEDTVERQCDAEAIRRLHFTYGYCMDKWLFEDIVDLYAEDCRLYFMNGAWEGRAGARRLYNWTNGLRGPQDGMLAEHVLAQDVIDIAPDRSRGWGRFRVLLLCGVHEAWRGKFPEGWPAQFWEGGVHENEYVREGGTWKIAVFNYRIAFQFAHDTGWARSPIDPLMVANLTRTFPEDPNGPDRLREPQPQWPRANAMPFHFNHPVTGRPLRLG